VSDSPEGLTNELQRRSSFLATSGGFRDIWKCTLLKANGNVDVAVKTIRAFETDNEESIQKNARGVRHELKVWGRLKHHSILLLWGVVNDFGPYPAMICPWADNGALTGFLERQQDKLSSLDKFSLLNDIALGLQYLHRKSVVHDDLTGSNVLIYANGRTCLAGFGFSTVILEFVGTSYFMSSIRENVRWVAAEL
jgi:serine/threonine protein kinase